MAGLKKLRAIRGNLAKLARDKTALKSELTDLFQAFLNRGQRKFHDKLNSEAVSERFNNTIASRRLFRAFNTDINKSLKFGRDGNVRFAFLLNSSGKKGNSDPTEYYAAIDDTNTRRRGPSLERVIEWLNERGIIQKGRKTITTRKGKRTNIRAFAFAVQRAIWKRNANREYKSLRLSEMFADIIDIKNPKSDFRQTFIGKVSNMILDKTA